MLVCFLASLVLVGIYFWKERYWGVSEHSYMRVVEFDPINTTLNLVFYPSTTFLMDYPRRVFYDMPLVFALVFNAILRGFLTASFC